MAHDDILKQLSEWTAFLRFVKKDISSGQIRNFVNVLNGLKRLAKPILNLRNKQKDERILRACVHVEDSREKLQDIVSDSLNEPASWIKVTNRLDDLIAELDGLLELLAERQKVAAQGKPDKPIPIGEGRIPKELAEAIGEILEQGGMRRRIEDQTGLLEIVYDELETKRVFASFLRQYNELRKSFPQLPHPNVDGSDPLAGLAQIQALCMDNVQNNQQPKAGQDKPTLPDYRALDLAKWMLTIGANTHVIKSTRIWDFLKDLCSALRDDRIVSTFEGTTNNKNNVDRLRKQIGKDALHKLIVSENGGYKLHPEVKILNSGQVGIRKTHLSRKRE